MKRSLWRHGESLQKVRCETLVLTNGRVTYGGSRERSDKTVLQECVCKSVLQESHARVHYKERPTRVFVIQRRRTHKSVVQQGSRIRVSLMRVAQECRFRRVLQECEAQVSRKQQTCFPLRSVLERCHTKRVSRKSVPQECLSYKGVAHTRV